ncbi:hypothetical protein [Salinivibrio proteolyticus]|uniref:Glycosyl transferase family 1 domain-containing protein n=1 Tax=Salinivibrio proteolyticus TaxID=334715 RepID=A0ABY7L9N3_9GAMM|nr:hypothetical protein [Salinivibrio proteolyticus]WBA13955.1 hypothetical protein N7E60_09465 [Salinivibrio proteolyticus]
MRVLISDFYNHVNCMNSAVQLYSKFGDIDLHAPKGCDGYHDINTLTSYSLIFYFDLIIKAIRYEKVVILTGPEHLKGLRGLIYAISFYIFAYIHKRKLILNIRTVDSYVRRKGIYKLLKAASNNMGLLTFESDACKKEYCTQNKCKNALVTYIYYPSVERVTFLPGCETTIGLLGMVNSKKRDYKIVYDALNYILYNKGIKFTVYAIGAYREKDCIFESLKEVCNLVYVEHFLSENEMLEMVKNCGFFISPNKAEMRYGYSKGTGAFGDAIKYNRKLIVPSFTDPIKEFSSFSSYYNNVNELVSSILSNYKKQDDNSVFEKYELAEIQKRLSGLIVKG